MVGGSLIIRADTKQKLHAALRKVLAGEPVQGDADPIRPVGLIFRTLDFLFIDFSVQRRPDRTVVHIALCTRAETKRVGLLVVDPQLTRRFIYPSDTDTDQIAQDAADKFWAAAYLPDTGVRKENINEQTGTYQAF